MAKLDQEDINFLEDLSEELRRHNGTYDPEAEELENIVFRTKQPEGEKGRVNFICSECGKQSRFQVNLETYVVSIKDLICDDCNPVEEE